MTASRFSKPVIRLVFMPELASVLLRGVLVTCVRFGVQVSALIVVPLASVAVSLWRDGEPLSWTWLKSFGGAVSATVGAMALFDRWAWKKPLLQGWFVKRPILAGDWTFMIKSLWTDPQANRRPEPFEARVTIRQTYTHYLLHSRGEPAVIATCGPDGSERVGDTDPCSPGRPT